MSVTHTLWSLLFVYISSSAGSSVGLPPVLDISLLEAAGEPGCDADLTVLKEGLVTRQLWAQSMYDAGVKGAVGVLSETYVQFGDFDECLLIRGPVTPQFCLVDVTSALSNSSWETLKWGVCLPSSCSGPQLASSIQDAMDRATPNATHVSVGVNPAACTTPETITSPLTPKDIIYGAVMLTVLLLVVLSTAHDLRTDPDYDGVSPPRTIVQCLSARHGFHSLLRNDQPVSGVDLKALYGLHTLACTFVVVGHRFCTFLLFMSVTNYRSVDYIFYGNRFFSLWTTHFDLFVDLFFFMSSFLLALFYYSELQKRFVNPFLVYFGRLSRILPAYAVIVFFYATLLRQVGSGPMWNFVMDQEQAACKEYWWTNLLFINTYIHSESLCIFQSWFIATDFQLFLLATLAVLLFHQRPHLGAIVIGLLFVASSIAPFLGTYLYDRPGMHLFNREFLISPRTNDMFTTVYSQAHYRGTSYIPGLVAGIYVYKRRHQPLDKTQTTLFQAAGGVIILLVFWSGSLFYNPAETPGKLAASLYAATFHSVFGLGLALFVISCTIGTPTFLARLFSWKGFVPLGKLSFCVYLVHFMIQIIWISSTRTAVHMYPLELVSWVIADMAICLLIALVMFLTIETPTRYLVKFLITGSSATSSSSQEQMAEPKEVYIVPELINHSKKEDPSFQNKTGSM